MKKRATPSVPLLMPIPRTYFRTMRQLLDPLRRAQVDVAEHPDDVIGLVLHFSKRRRPRTASSGEECAPSTGQRLETKAFVEIFTTPENSRTSVRRDPVQLVVKLKVEVTPEASAHLLATQAAVNATCTWIATQAMGLAPTARASAFALHRAFYATARTLFALPAQLVVRALAKVAASFARDPSVVPTFRATGAVPYDARCLSFRALDATGLPTAVTLTTLAGRVAGTLRGGGPSLALLRGTRGASQLVLRKGRWYLHTTVNVEAPAPTPPRDWLGVDLGIVNLATDSDGVIHTGARVEAVRVRHQRLRTALQACGTRSAKKHLKRLSGQEARFRTDTNHVLSKQLVQKAQGTGRGLALEDLQGIRDRVTVSRGQRARLGAWAFFQLRFFVSYKAQRAGVALAGVDPRDTSRTCPRCGCVDRRNRRSQAEFLCIQCGFAAHADVVGAVNIARRAAVDRPLVSSDDAGNGRELVSLAETPPSSGASPVL